jgi:hypothetical protein
MLKLKSILDNLDSLPVELHDYYEEKDGKFYLSLDDDIKTHPAVNALSNAYRQEQTKRREARAEVEALKARLTGVPDDFDAATYEDLKAKAAASDGKTVDEQVTRCREAMQVKIDMQATKHAAELAAKDQVIAGLRAQSERDTIERNLSSAMDEANIDPKHRKKLAPYLRTLGKIKVVDDDGSPSTMVDTDMGEVSLSKFITDWAGTDDGKEYVKKPTGLDTNGSDQRRVDGNPFEAANWNKTEQGRMMQKDRGKAERYAKAAGFKSLEIAASASAPIKK